VVAVTGAGLAGLVVAAGAAVGFVVSTVRADRRVHEADPGGLSGLGGWPRRWALVAVLAGVGSVLLLAGGLFGGDVPVTPR
jgi:hypothetical protein